MSDQKNQQYRPGLYHGETNGNRQSNGTATNDRRSSKQPDRRSSEQQGWEAYRKWLSRDNTQPAQRSPLDASIYSWRGYNNWADKVRQTWKADEPADS